ncbi:MAG: protein kinase domain-containing protein [Thermoanaerobaculia bacterium]
MTISPGSRLGPYEVLSPLGAGGMGEVYKARDTRLERTVAIKVLPSHLSSNEEVRQRFEREAKTISSLSHPHICGLYDVGREGETDYLVMEYLEGETLTDRLSRGALPTEQVLRYGIEVADALDKAHRQGIVHRDLKPGNIMLTKTGVKLLDFGLAKFSAPVSGASSLSVLPTQAGANLTVEGTILGTYQYMAPEQLEGKEADTRTDIFAFGAVLYEMATARKAFEGKSQASLIAAILEHTPPPVSTVQPMTPPAFDRVVRNCLAKDPEDRWQSAHDVGSELKWIAEAGSQAGAPAGVVSKRRIRERAAWAGFAIATLLAALFAVAYLRRVPAPGRPIRSLILLPEKLSLNDLAISPDGTRLVFSALNPEGRSLLWVRSLDSTSTQPLPGTEKAVLPFWSPDSRTIGFFADAKLKRIEASGGPALTLCDADGVGGTWNRDGIILFSRASGPIDRIPAAGGQPAPVTRLNESRHETTNRYPRFLPDGRHFLYVAGNLAGQPEDEANQVHVASLDSKEDRILLRGYSNTIYASGYLLYVRDGNLFAQAFDPKRLQVSGEPVSVAQRVSGFDQYWKLAKFSASDNGIIAHGSSETSLWQLSWFDRAGRRIGTFGDPAPYAAPRISPDGRRVAVEIFEESNQKAQLWICDLTRGLKEQFTSGPSANQSPVWSPDGNRILFASDRKHQADLYLKIASGAGQEEPLLEAEGQKLPDDWSPDGRYIAFENREPRGDRHVDLALLPLFGDRRPIALLRRKNNPGEARFSPDGRWIAYSTEEAGRYEVYVSTYPNPGSRWRVSTAGGSQPRWRRDGKELFYFAADGKLMAVEIKPGRTFEVGIPRFLFEPRLPRVPGFFNLYDVSADGQRFLMTTPVGEGTSLPIDLIVNWPAALKK